MNTHYRLMVLGAVMALAVAGVTACSTPAGTEQAEASSRPAQTTNQQAEENTAVEVLEIMAETALEQVAGGPIGANMTDAAEIIYEGLDIREKLRERNKKAGVEAKHDNGQYWDQVWDDFKESRLGKWLLD